MAFNLIGVMLNLAIALSQSGKKSEALDILKKALVIDPDNKSVKFLLSKFSP